MGIAIQSRDRKVLKFVFSYRVVTFEQISRKFFAKSHFTIASRRVRKMVEERLLKQIPSHKDGRLIKCLGITEKGLKLVCEDWEFEIDNPYFKSESPIHDFHLAELGTRFESLTLFEHFYPENLLQSSTAFQGDPMFRDLVRLNSDAVLLLKDQNGDQLVYAVEYEASKKSPSRYVDKLGSYYQVGSIDGLLYICSSQMIADAVARADKQICKQDESFVYLTTEEDALKPSKKLIFRGTKGGGIRLY